MNKRLPKDTRGLAHVGLIAIAVLVLAVVAFAGWRVMENNANSKSKDKTATVCDTDDQDLCKFLFSFKSVDSYRATVASKDSKGAQTTATFETDSDGDSRVLVKGIKVKDKSVSFEYIVIGKTIYFKSSDGNWWKQALSTEKEKEYTSSYDFDLEEPDSTKDPAAQIKYKSVGQDYCDIYWCFKYQVIDPGNPGSVQYIWFDTQQYLLRRMTTNSGGTSTDVSFKYVDITIGAPSSVKILGPNQYILPGQSKPATLPSGAAGI
jgi:hypothetical protein